MGATVVLTGPFIPLLLASPLLVATGYSDLRRMRIPNALSIIALVLFAVCAPLFLTLDQVVDRVIAAGCVLAIGFLMFSFRLVGGGDVKFLAALFLFVPGPTMQIFMLVFSAALVMGMALMPVLRALPRAGSAGWVSLRRDAKFPMGISIAMAGLAHPLVCVALLG